MNRYLEIFGCITAFAILLGLSMFSPLGAFGLAIFMSVAPVPLVICAVRTSPFTMSCSVMAGLILLTFTSSYTSSVYLIMLALVMMSIAFGLGCGFHRMVHAPAATRPIGEIESEQEPKKLNFFQALAKAKLFYIPASEVYITFFQGYCGAITSLAVITGAFPILTGSNLQETFDMALVNVSLMLKNLNVPEAIEQTAQLLSMIEDTRVVLQQNLPVMLYLGLLVLTFICFSVSHTILRRMYPEKVLPLIPFAFWQIPKQMFNIITILLLISLMAPGDNETDLFLRFIGDVSTLFIFIFTFQGLAVVDFFIRSRFRVHRFFRYILWVVLIFAAGTELFLILLGVTDIVFNLRRIVYPPIVTFAPIPRRKKTAETNSASTLDKTEENTEYKTTEDIKTLSIDPEPTDPNIFNEANEEDSQVKGDESDPERLD